MNLKESFVKAQNLHRHGKFRDAEKAYRIILKHKPRHPEVSFYLGLVLLQTARSGAAIKFFRRTVDSAPNNAIAHDHLGQALLDSGRVEGALREHRRAVELSPKQPEVIANLAWTLDSAGLYVEAEDRYRDSLDVAPDLFPAVANYGAMLNKIGRYRESVPLLRKAHRLNPKAPEPLASLALSLDRLNETVEADAVIATLNAVAPAYPACPLVNGMQQLRQGNPEAAIQLLREATRTRLQPQHLATAWFMLSQALDSVGDFHSAFAAVRRAKKIREGSPRFAVEQLDTYPDRIAKYRRWFHASRLQAAPKARTGHAGNPVFFVGFPRSGTTLMEQVLGAHPAFDTTNEKSPLLAIFSEFGATRDRPVRLPEDLERLGPDECSELRARFHAIAEDVTGVKGGKTRLVDKIPMNIIELGPANWLFPESPAVVALRDPRDVVLSCYMQQFQPNPAMIQFHDLDNAARFYAQVMSLWLHYREVLTMPWIEYRYEDLITDFEGTVRKVLEFLGVGWDESTTRYADRARSQDIGTPSFRAVTQPLYSRAVGRWRNYRNELAPVLPVLEPFVREFGYEPD